MSISNPPASVRTCVTRDGHDRGSRATRGVDEGAVELGTAGDDQRLIVE